MDFLWDKITEWLKEMLIGGIVSNLSGMFDATNQKVAEISGQVGLSPQAWNGSIFSMIQNLSETVIVPIAGAILAFVMTLELIQLITDKNNLNDMDTWIFFKWAFKSAAAVLIVTNTWTIVMGVFDAAQSVVASASGLIIGDTSINISSVMVGIEDRLMEMELGPLFGLWFQSLFVGITMWALTICIFIITFGRMIEIYLVTSVAPIPMATMMGKEWGGMGQNYIRSLLALGFQAFLIIVCVIDLIKKLTNVTLDSEKDIQAARKAYDALTDLQKLLVDNYDILTTAETKLAMLKAMGKVSDPYISTGDYMEKLGTPGIGAVGGEWMVIGLARSERTVPGVEDYYKKVLEYVAENIDPETGRLHKAKSTDNSRIIIALTAIGKDVTNVGGYNLLAGLSDLEFVKYQGNNGPIWALLALDSGNYPVPSGGTVTRQALIDEILRVQTSDGGWTVYGDKADSDMTGMALTALAPYYTKDLKVQEAIDKAIARLSEMQDEDGGYSTSYDGTTKIATSESISQVVTALSALGINADTDPRFVKNVQQLLYRGHQPPV
jgi:hypothetical protein